MSSSHSSVSEWIEALKTGDPQAAEKLWAKYFQRLMDRMCGKMRHVSKRDADEEDVVLMAFEICFRRVREGHYPSLQGRDELWLLLIQAADWRMNDHLRRTVRQENGVYPDGSAHQPLLALPAMEPTPEIVAETEEQCRRMLGVLEQKEQQVALLKLQGYKHREIAEQLDRSVVSIERYVRSIKEKWAREIEKDIR